MCTNIEDIISNNKFDRIVYELQNNSIQNIQDFDSVRKILKEKYKIIASNSDFIKAYHMLKLNNDKLKYILTKKKSKSNSGVIVITVLTSANPEYIDDKGNNIISSFSCKWNCHYCPNEKAHEGNGYVDQPRSYLFQEPAVLRANENNFDPILQFNSRVSTLIAMGHNIDKIELIVLGGTWCNYPIQYQEQFIKKLYYAANVFYEKDKRDILSLEEEITINENAVLHIIGLTLETRPDTICIQEIERFRKYNCTRIQLGVQHTNNEILRKINRGHSIECVYDAIKLLKNNGYKVDLHLMPNLPGSSYELDKKMLNDILYDTRLQADQLKIYPCAIVPFTKIKEWYDNGEYIPYDDMYLYLLIKEFKQKVHPYIRLNRIIRDIPSSYIYAGYSNKSINMRQLMQKDMKKNGWKCKCIRCREINDNIIDINDVKLKIINYDASDGIEYYISFETDDYLIGFIRLRINFNYDNVFNVLKNAALIRELHVYSNISCVGENNDNSMQHRGFGKKLIEKAEDIALQNNLFKIAIISGTGVRNYYKKMGYHLVDTYMIKYLNKPHLCSIQ